MKTTVRNHYAPTLMTNSNNSNNLTVESAGEDAEQLELTLCGW